MNSNDNYISILDKSREEIKKLLKEGKITIAVYGLGYVGLPLAVVFAKAGAKVIGVDIDEEKVKKVNNGINYILEEKYLTELLKEVVEKGNLTATTDGIWASKNSQVKIICVPVLADDHGNIDLSKLIDVTQKIGKGLKRGDIVIVETSVPPGTTESLIPILEKESGLKIGEFGIAHAPERIQAGSAIEDITIKFPRIVGASDKKTLEVVTGLYEIICEKGVLQASSIKVAEAAKIFDGIYRDVNIALANELGLWAEEHGIDAMEVIELANTHPERHLHKPGAGVGGHCIPIYPWFLINTSKKYKLELIRLARKINLEMPYHIVYLAIKGLNKVGKSIKDSNILILGLAFRWGVRSTINSPAIPIIKELKELGAKVYVHDPYVDKKEAEKLGVEWKEDFKDIDAIIIVTDHKEYKNIDIEKLKREMRHKVIIDGRNILNYKKFIEEGFIYLGPGRVFE